MTGGADVLVETGVNLRMTIVATKGRTVGFKLVGSQQKAKRIVREADITNVYQRRVWTAMVGVAVAAGHIGIVLAQDAVQRGRLLPLGGHIGMTDLTPVGHGGDAPEGDVTQAALAGDFRMGAHAAQCRAGQCVEGTGAEHHAARGESEPCHDEGGEDGSHDAGGCKTTQT